jgi:hypothetical protein
MPNWRSVLGDYSPSVFLTNLDARDSNHPARRESSAQTSVFENKAVDSAHSARLAGRTGGTPRNGVKTRGKPAFLGHLETLTAHGLSDLTPRRKFDFN